MNNFGDDILRTGKDDKTSSYFIGSIVYIKEGIYQHSSVPSLLVIDGQQRLTTVSLIIEALSRHIGDTEPLKGFSAKKLRNNYLLNSNEEGEDHYKLILTQTDKKSLLALFNQKPWPIDSSFKINRILNFLRKR